MYRSLTVFQVKLFIKNIMDDAGIVEKDNSDSEEEVKDEINPAGTDMRCRMCKKRAKNLLCMPCLHVTQCSACDRAKYCLECGMCVEKEMIIKIV